MYVKKLPYKKEKTKKKVNSLMIQRLCQNAEK